MGDAYGAAFVAGEHHLEVQQQQQLLPKGLLGPGRLEGVNHWPTVANSCGTEEEAQDVYVKLGAEAHLLRHTTALERVGEPVESQNSVEPAALVFRDSRTVQYIWPSQQLRLEGVCGELRRTTAVRERTGGRQLHGNQEACVVRSKAILALEGEAGGTAGGGSAVTVGGSC